MNSKAQTLFISVLVAGMIFFAGVIVVNFIKDDVTTARGADALNCSSSTISDGNKIACLGTDIVIPYFIIIVLSAAGGLITSRLLL